MPIDKHVPAPEPGIAGFSRESWDSDQDPRYGEGVPTTTHETVSSPGALNLKLYSVVNISAAGVISMAEYAAGESNANAILATAGAVFGAGDSMSLPFYREGHWNMDALVWHASFDTDEKKRRAFEGSISPNIFVSKKKFPNSAIDI